MKAAAYITAGLILVGVSITLEQAQGADAIRGVLLASGVGLICLGGARDWRRRRQGTDPSDEDLLKRILGELGEAGHPVPKAEVCEAVRPLWSRTVSDDEVDERMSDCLAALAMTGEAMQTPDGSCWESSDAHSRWIRSLDPSGNDPLPDTDQLLMPVLNAVRSAHHSVEWIASAVDIPNAPPDHREIVGARVEEGLRLLARQGFVKQRRGEWQATERGSVASEEDVAEAWISDIRQDALSAVALSKRISSTG